MLDPQSTHHRVLVIMIYNGCGLKLVRQYTDVTQSEIAKRLGVTQASVSLWESKRRRPGPKTIIRYLNVLCESLPDLLIYFTAASGYLTTKEEKVANASC